MRLKSVTVRGFQSFSDSGEITFGNGINLLIGQNNVGKSALLRALRSPLENLRHRSADKWQEHQLVEPRVLMTIEVSGKEINDQALRQGTLYLSSGGMSEDRLKDIWLDIAENGHSFKMVRRPQSFLSQTFPDHGRFISDSVPSTRVASFQVRPDGVTFNGIHKGGTSSLPESVNEIWARSFFYFSAERLTVGVHDHGPAQRLTPNASNLPAVLHTLSGTRGSVFRRLVNHLREIFPSTVGNLSTVPISGSQNEIRVWPTAEQEYPELSFALNDSGTGVAQVIAILTAVMTVENAVVAIDEINSFLHPAAVKSLLRILVTNYSQHQYIISTHAPEVISYSNPDTVHLVRREGYESTVVSINLQNIDQLRIVADHLGVSMGDVFAAERIIWVEGATEEICFPYIYRELIGPLPSGTLITSVVATGDLSGKPRTREVVIDVYRRLSAAAQPLVTSVVFSFDAEKLTKPQQAKMRKDSGDTLYFLPRRLFECYLIDADAIAAFINVRDEAKVTVAAVTTALVDFAAKPELSGTSWKGDLRDEAWLEQVDGAKLIDRCMGAVTEQRVRFFKKGDSLELLKTIMQNDPERMRPLAEYLDRLVKAVTR